MDNIDIFLFSDFTDQLHLLADAFNKYEVTNTAMMMMIVQVISIYPLIIIG